MRAALVTAFNEAPIYGEFRTPEPSAGFTTVTMKAAALSRLVRGQAAGTHYSSQANFPFVPGFDGIGTLPDGRRVYCFFPESPFGTMAEQTLIHPQNYVPVPDGLDDVTAAAIANPGMSCWPALTVRSRFMPGETVLINGATGVAGKLAIQVAKYLGASRVIATGRNPAVFDELKSLGADLVLPLTSEPGALTQAVREQAGKIDIVLDYLWGSAAEEIIAAVAGHGSAAGEPPVRFVQIGNLAGPTISLAAQSLRSSGLQLLGSGLGSVSAEDLLAAIGELMNAVVPGNFHVEADAIPLADVHTAWTNATSDRIVFTL